MGMRLKIQRPNTLIFLFTDGCVSILHSRLLRPGIVDDAMDINT